MDVYPYYIGVKQAKEGYAAIHQAVPFDFVVLSGNGKKIAAPELEASVYKVVWNNVLKKDKNG
ncbi:MAG: hypothetical protein WCP53_04480, partial [Verrucomicrobiota bacterium]